MKQLVLSVKKFVKEDAGASLFEYAVIIGVGTAGGALLGALVVPQIRAAFGRAANALAATAGW